MTLRKSVLQLWKIYSHRLRGLSGGRPKEAPGLSIGTIGARPHRYGGLLGSRWGVLGEPGMPI